MRKKKKKKTVKKGLHGRPSDYKPEYDEQARKLCLLGLTDRELSDFFHVSEQTVNAWKHAHPSFLESMLAGKEKADAEVAHSMYHRAKGYEHKAVKIFADPKSGAQHIVEYVERYAPDTTAGSLWLRNRQPKRWRDKQEHEHSGPNGGPIKSNLELTPSEAYLAMLGGKK